MGRIIAFPVPTKRPPVESAKQVPTMNAPTDVAKPRAQSRMLSVVWILFLLMWPLVQWLVAFDIVYQFLRALYYWNAPGVHARITFLIHLIAASVLSYCVATRPIK